MRIAAGRIVLDFFNNDNLPLKRKNLKELCDSLRKKYNVSAAEVDSFDEMERCVIGFAAVTRADWKPREAQALLDQILKELDALAFARVMVENSELIEFGEGESEDL